ncbi:hypothetical protein KBY25_15605 [Ruegeria pomeroyi]|nr:hypothetical protein [Ruegeria pomeroyi]
MKRPDLNFRKAQAAHDLIWLLQSQNDVRLIRCGGESFPTVVRQQSSRFEREADAECFADLAAKALDAAEGSNFAVAMIVANDLQDGLWSGAAREFAELAPAGLRSAPRHLRTAILRGLDALAENRPNNERTEYLWPELSRLTRSLNQILPKLCRIARAMDEPTRRSVAAADYVPDAEKHLEALNVVLASETCLFPKDDTWFPSEVVELVSHNRQKPGFVPCTALLLANAMQSRDNEGWFDFRLHSLTAEYTTLPTRVRDPLIAGVRFLYEPDKSFLAYRGDRRFDPITSTKSLIDFVELPDDDFST